MLLEISHQIRVAAKNGMAIAELEYLGLSVRTINALDSSKYVFLKDLIECDISRIKSLGSNGVQELREAFHRFPELDKNRKRWNKGSDRLDYYMSRIPKGD